MTIMFRTAFAVVPLLMMVSTPAASQSGSGRVLTADLTPLAGNENPASGTVTFHVNVGLHQICYDYAIPNAHSLITTLYRTDIVLILIDSGNPECISSAGSSGAGLEWSDSELKHLVQHPEDYGVSVEGAIDGWTGTLSR